MEALFNEMNHATKAIGTDEKKGLAEEAKKDKSRGEKKFIEINTNE